MIVELYHPEGYESAAIRVMVHVTPNEWSHLYCYGSLTYPTFRLVQHESTRFLAVPRVRGQQVDPMTVYHVLRREFMRAGLKHQNDYASRGRRSLPANVTLHASLKRKD